MIADDKLVDATQRYLAFIDRMSQGEEFPQEEVASSLIAPDCKKILNGKLYTESRSAFIEDLIKVNQTLGCWKVKVVDRITSPHSNTVVLRLMIDLENAGAFTEILILRYNSDCLISEMNVVFSKVEGSYNFDS
jgi:hypothetical protein